MNLSFQLCFCFSQVLIEGVADRQGSGLIAVDNIQIMDGLNIQDCRSQFYLLLVYLDNNNNSCISKSWTYESNLQDFMLTCFDSVCFNLIKVFFLLQIQKLLPLLPLISSCCVSFLHFTAMRFTSVKHKLIN